jgi:hypothetical protein
MNFRIGMSGDSQVEGMNFCDSQVSQYVVFGQMCVAFPMSL